MDIKCHVCGMTFLEEDFKSLTTGQLVSTCKCCRSRISTYNRLKRKGFNRELVDVFKKAKPTFFKNEPYCMRCGKPFYHKIEQDESGGTKTIPKKNHTEWGLYINRHNKKVIMCLDCLEDRLNDNKFNLYKYEDMYDRMGVCIKNGVCIDDLTIDEYDYLYCDYPFKKLKKKKTEIYGYIKSVMVEIQERVKQLNNRI